MKDEIKLGRLILVENKNRAAQENKNYYAIQVEAIDGENEECLLFTEKELESLTIVDTQINLIDGRLYPFSDNVFHGYLLKTTEKYEDKWLVVIRKLTERKYLIAQNRAAKNPEDLTKKSWFTDLLD